MFAGGHVLEEIAGELPRRRADQHGTRRGECLQPGCQIRRFADHRLLPLIAADLTDDHAGRDADACLQRLTIGTLQPRDRSDDLERRADGAFCRLFLRLWVSEVGEHAVAQVLGDVSVELGDNGGAGLAITAQQLVQVLRVELAREGGRAHEVCEHHRDLAALDLLRELGRDASRRPARRSMNAALPRRP